MYAKSRVHGAMLDALRKQDSVSRSGRGAIKADGLERTPWATLYPVPLDTTVDKVSAVTDPSSALAEALDNAALVHELMAVLPRRHKYLIQMYYLEDRSLFEIAECLGISESRVCQVKKEALALMLARAKRK